VVTIEQAIEQHGALKVFHACDGEPGCPARMAALGLPEPKTYGDVYKAMTVAWKALSDAERAAEGRRDRMRLDYLASATKVPGAAPNMPRDWPSKRSI
jgi:hypothetical protein